MYLEANPLQLRGPAVYRNKVRLALPGVKQIDASEFFPSAVLCVFLLKREESCPDSWSSFCEGFVMKETGSAIMGG